MATEFSDLTSLSTSPHKGGDAAKSSSKKRAATGGRVRLRPLDGSSSTSYELPSNNNNNNQSGSTTINTAPSTALPLFSFGKLKKITQKRELVEAVRKANSPILLPTREGLGISLRHEGSATSVLSADDGGGGSGGAGASTSTKDIETLEDGVHANARKFNEHKMQADRRQREVNALLDELHTLQLETQELSRLQNQETPIARTSQRLRREIEECTASMEQQMHLRRQLEHMVRRLQSGQLKIDAHLEAMAKAVEASQAESEEVKLLCRQLEAGKSRAVQSLQEVQLQLQLERKARARELSDHEIRARNAQKMEAWRMQRMQERAELAAELRGDLSNEEEQRLLRCIESRERANEALHQANLTKSQKAADYEEVLDQLKLAMGATSLVEVVEKIQSQALTAVSLEKEKTQAETRLVGVRQEKAHVVQALNELKASGIGGIELNREVYNTLEHEIQQAKATLKVNKAAYERLDGVIQAVRQGSSGLAQRLLAFDDVLDLSPTDVASASATATAAVSSGPGAGASVLPARGDNTDALALAELKLAKILELVGQQSSSVNGFGSGFGGSGSGSNSSGGSGDASDEGFDDAGSSRADLLDERHALWSPSANNDPVLHLNNIRVRPPKRGALGGHFVDLDTASESLDSARSDASAASESDVAMDVLVPSRDILKMSSSRHFAEVMRKRELLEKQKAAAERGISDEEMLSKQRKKNQLESDARLATSPSKTHTLLQPGATGVSSKDDALSRSFAFVTQINFNEL
ncbi:hypothetical protein P43SY_007520 [Pythium insidiosum]|uniref:Uncharacterized protein n=1 Tax=Pythium insidiosum TaxID=114742 RepID=A0AAD5LJ10_PYTIN|nr:hypothetical protein P43SY_007520 [Pythium insidiosum]